MGTTSSRLSSPCSVTGGSNSFGPRLLLRLRGGALHADSPPQPLLPPKLPPLPGRKDADAPCDDDDDVGGRARPRVRKASRMSSPSSDGMRSRCMLLLRLGGWLALAVSLYEAIVARVGGRAEADEDVAPD